jgi:RNA polymerase sigma factor (sigma-70 family)
MPLDIDHLYRRYGAMVFRRCRHLLKDEGEAKDAMQDAFVNLIQAHENLAEDYPSSLLYRVATNVCLNRIRTRRRHPEDRDEMLLARIADSADPEATLAAGGFLGRLFGTAREPASGSMGTDGESSRVMAVLHFVDGMTLEEVARVCGMSVSGVRKRLRKIQAKALELKAREEWELRT